MTSSTCNLLLFAQIFALNDILRHPFRTPRRAFSTGDDYLNDAVEMSSSEWRESDEEGGNSSNKERWNELLNRL